MASITTDTADDVGGEVSLLGAIILAVSNLTTYSSWSEVELDYEGMNTYSFGKLGSRRHGEYR